MKKISLIVGVLLLMLLLPCAVSALGNISVSSVPAGATILVDSENKGVAPLTVVNLTSGSRNVLLQYGGYRDNLTSVTVVDGGTATLSVNLIPTTSSPTISSTSPTSATNSGSQTIVIAGTGFNGANVSLTKSGEPTVTGFVTATPDIAISISRNFNLNGIASGTWNLVILNSDGGTVTGTFTVNSATTATVTSISPTTGTVNTSVSTTVAGTGFVPSSAKIRLYRSGNYIGGSVNSGGTTIQLTGTFNLNQATPGAYEVCILPDGTETSKICGPTFTILSTSGTNGTISVKSSPSISKIFLNSVFQGYTPMTLENITPSTYTVMIRSVGYKDYSESVKVTPANISYVTASLVLAPEETTVTTTAKNNRDNRENHCNVHGKSPHAVAYRYPDTCIPG